MFGKFIRRPGGDEAEMAGGAALRLTNGPPSVAEFGRPGEGHLVGGESGD